MHWLLHKLKVWLKLGACSFIVGSCGTTYPVEQGNPRVVASNRDPAPWMACLRILRV